MSRRPRRNHTAAFKARWQLRLSGANTQRKIYRPRGSYDSVDAGDRFQVKRIVVKPGAALCLQMHHHRAEHWIVVSEIARVPCGEEIFLLVS